MGSDKELTLAEWVIMKVENGEQKSREFQLALEFWGREKFEKIWKEHIKNKKEAK